MLILVITEEQEDKDVTNDAEFSYKEVSELSDATDDIQAESVPDDDF